jgi:hypothetical protein
MTISEADFQAQVVDIARWNRWSHIYHTHDSRRSAPGFPDLVLARPGELAFAELKTDTGRPTPTQLAWLAVLATVEAATEGTVHAHLWRPSDIDTITATLARKGTRP